MIIHGNPNTRQSNNSDMTGVISVSSFNGVYCMPLPVDSWVKMPEKSMDWQEEPGRLGLSITAPGGPGRVHGLLHSMIAVRA